MIKTHFKRHGSAGLLILQGLPKNYYAEYDHKRGYLKLTGCWEIPKKWNGETYYENHSETALYKDDYPKTEDGKENISDIEKRINEVMSHKIIIDNSFIESYHIAGRENKTDRHILNELNITEMNTLQVITSCKINLLKFFEPWHVEKISRFLIKPTEKMLTMNFSELYSLIHWNSHKQNFDELFISSI